MKTCLYCGGNNADSAKICMMCGRDLHTGDQLSGHNGAADAEKRAAARLALPRPESRFANLLLLVPALVLYLLGMALVLEPSMGYFYDLKLPALANGGAMGGILILVSIVMVFSMILRTTRAFRVYKGYQMILREEGDERHALVKAYNRYRKYATSLRSLLRLIPVAAFGALMCIMYFGKIAYYMIFLGIRIALPDVEDPLPYMLMIFVGLVFLLVRFVAGFRVTLSYRRYEKFLRGEDVRGFGSVRTGMAAALDARQYPQPETPFIYLLLLPSVLVLSLIGLLIAVAYDVDYFLGMVPPRFANPEGASILLMASAAVLLLVMILCIRRQRAVTRGYFEALRMTEETPFSANLEKYAHYQRQACDFYCFLWLLPVALILGIMQLLYISSYARYATILDQYKLILPQVEEPLPYVLMSVIAVIFLAILFFATLNNTLAYRRCDLANRKRHREEDERAAAEAAAVAANELAAEAAEEESILGDIVAEEKTADASADDDTFFLHAGETVVTTAASSEMDRLDPLERLRAIDASGVAPGAAYRKAADLHQLCDWFMNFAKANGYEPEETSVRALLAAMVTSRVVFIRTRDEASAAFAAKISTFFGSNASVAEVTSLWNSPDALLFNTTSDAKTASDCLCGLYRASYADDSICTMTLTGAQNGAADRYLKDVLAYAEKPERADLMPVLEAVPSASKLSARVQTRNGGVYMPLSENIWCLAVSSDATKYAIPAAGYTTGAALAVCLRGKACEPVAEEAAVTDLSASAFRRLSRGVLERCFLPEEQWKKFDRIEAFLQMRAGVRFDNRLMRRLESFSSAYLAVNNDANQILDAMLEAVFLPMIARLDPALLGSIDGSAGICETMALSFGADNIPYCMQTLHELGFEA